MKKVLTSAAIALSCIMSVPAQASAADLSVCLADSLNGKERKQMAQWVFFAMAAHPEIKAYANFSNAEKEKMDKDIGHLMTRLIAKDCPNQVVAALEQDPLAIQRSFEFVGQVAMQELMADPDVTNSIAAYAQYVDQKAIAEVLVK